MRLGWYARLVIVGVVFWTIGDGFRDLERKQKSVSELRQTYYRTCIEDQVANKKPRDMKPGESCGSYSQRQFYWMDDMDSVWYTFGQSFLAGLAYALLAGILYLAGRWVLAGRAAKSQTQDPT